MLHCQDANLVCSGMMTEMAMVLREPKGISPREFLLLVEFIFEGLYVQVDGTCMP
jgi:hypothetical protein